MVILCLTAQNRPNLAPNKTGGKENMSEIKIEEQQLVGVGVARRLEVPAFRYQQGGRTQYNTVVSVLEVPTFVARKPDPNKPLDGNRKVDGPRAKRFGEYVFEKRDWVSPAIFV